VHCVHVGVFVVDALVQVGCSIIPDRCPDGGIEHCIVIAVPKLVVVVVVNDTSSL
jgi:hypothetical protein